MQAYLTLTRRELAGYFFSITGYVIMAAVALLIGLSFAILIKGLLNTPFSMPITELFYNSYLFWFILLLATPIITMRLFALEKFSGTFETLMTTPVSDAQVVAAKFTAALVFYMVMWLPLLACILFLQHYTLEAAALDAGAVGSTFLGIFLLGCLFISLGCFASSLSRSQMTAAMIALALSVGLFLISFLAEQLPAADWKSQALAMFNLQDQMHDFAHGMVDTRSVVLCLSVAFFFLFLTLRVIESRRWK
ncbi:MAG: gliding motility-associated transport system permease protein [Verrucomicrobiota bacterium]